MDSARSRLFKRKNLSRRGIISCDERDFCRGRLIWLFLRVSYDHSPLGWRKSSKSLETVLSIRVGHRVHDMVCAHAAIV